MEKAERGTWNVNNWQETRLQTRLTRPVGEKNKVLKVLLAAQDHECVRKAQTTFNNILWTWALLGQAENDSDTVCSLDHLQSLSLIPVSMLGVVFN